ncbi:hypothetical protein Tco_1268964 [Tanacetum coccineum]
MEFAQSVHFHGPTNSKKIEAGQGIASPGCSLLPEYSNTIEVTLGVPMPPFSTDGCYISKLDYQTGQLRLVLDAKPKLRNGQAAEEPKVLGLHLGSNEKHMANSPNGYNIWSVVRRLVFAASVYCLWQERNSRIFRDEKKYLEKLWR